MEGWLPFARGCRGDHSASPQKKNPQKIFNTCLIIRSTDTPTNKALHPLINLNYRILTPIFQ